MKTPFGHMDTCYFVFGLEITSPKTNFLVCDKLLTTILLGAKFIDKDVATMQIGDAEVELKDASRVPIIREETPSKFLKDTAILPSAGHIQKNFGKIRTVESVLLTPGKQTKVLVRADVAGALIVEPAQQPLTQYGVAATNGVQEVNDNHSFYLYIANFSEKRVRLAKRTLVA